MEWLDVETNYVSWWDDKKTGDYFKNTPLLTLKTCFGVSRFSHRGGTGNTVSGTGCILNAGIGFFPHISLYWENHEIPNDSKKSKILLLLYGGDPGCYRLDLGFYDLDPAGRVNSLYGLEEIS